jgi:hypothetical protein
MLAQKKTESAIGLLFSLKLFDYRRIGGLDSSQQAPENLNSRIVLGFARNFALTFFRTQDRGGSDAATLEERSN